MTIIAITVAYCPAALLGRMILANRVRPDFVVQGHYPINKKKNNNDIKLICEAFNIPVLDPGEDLGSAQSQNWALSQIGLNESDFFINLDPDSACHSDWVTAAKIVLYEDPYCMLISCMAPMVQRYMANRPPFIERNAVNVRYRIPQTPTPFNLSMWRYSFIKEIGGIPQMGPMWGETEGPFYAHCQARGKYHAYLLDYMEDENGKFMQDKQHNEFKDRHMRTLGDKQFLGTFTEFLALEYPHLLELDTCKDLDNNNHP